MPSIRGNEKWFNEVRAYFFSDNARIMKAEPNDEMAAVFEECLREAAGATLAIKLLPTPPGFMPGPAGVGIWIAKAGYAIFRDKHRKTSGDKMGIPVKGYLGMVRNVIRARKRSEVESYIRDEGVVGTCPEPSEQ